MRYSNQIIRSLCFFLALLLLESCEDGAPVEAPIIAIIAAPQDYDKAVVFTQGFFSMNQQARLFVSKEDALNFNVYHSILLNESNIAELSKLKACDNKFVTVSGIIAHDGNTKLRMIKPISIKSKSSSGQVAVSCKLTRISNSDPIKTVHSPTKRQLR